MQNPFERIREKLGLSRREFAIALGVSYHVLYSHLTGLPARIQSGLARGLAAMGLNPEQIDAEYQEWRKEQAKRIREA